MKKSAVEWLYERLERMIPRSALYNIDKEAYFEQAKELEKEQLKQCYHFAQIEQQKEFSSIYIGMSFEKWYNEIYKN